MEDVLPQKRRRLEARKRSRDEASSTAADPGAVTCSALTSYSLAHSHNTTMSSSTHMSTHTVTSSTAEPSKRKKRRGTHRPNSAGEPPTGAAHVVSAGIGSRCACT